MSVVQEIFIESRVHFLGYSILLYEKRGIEYRFQPIKYDRDRNDDRSDNDQRTMTTKQQQYSKSSSLHV
jgi:hypothetical protein